MTADVTQLAEQAQAAGFRLAYYERLGSTNDLCFERARQGEASRLWVVAQTQEQGRGRLGRHWLSPKGNLYASVVLIDEITQLLAPQLALVAGVALINAVRALCPPDVDLCLKWPNDVLSNDAKLAGILLEANVLADGRFALVMGFGVNCQSAPSGLPYPTACLADRGVAVSPAQMMRSLSHSLAFALQLWAGGDGFGAIREAWLANAGPLGRPLRIKRGAAEVNGVFAGIDHDGHLLLAGAGGIEVISAGEVFFPAQQG